MRTVKNAIPFVPWIPRAIFELIRARIVLARIEPQQLLALNAQTKALCSVNRRDGIQQDAALERVAFLLPRIGARTPWRSDCLVQALAAQRWLATYDIASEIEIGVRRDVDSTFLAHAWVIQNGKVVLGGETREFSPLLIQK